MILRQTKRLANRLLSPLGQAVVSSAFVPSFERFSGALSGAGLAPATVVDVGVAFGTPWLYGAFPDAEFHLIDPTRESLPHMNEWARKLDATVHNIALGDRTGEMEIAIQPDIAGSSLFREFGESSAVNSYAVPVRRFDELNFEIARPSLCKIDVQGAELMVLEGMGRRLEEFDAFVVETSLIATLADGAPEFAAVVAFMKGRGFVLYDIVGLLRRPLDQALAQIDAVFVPETSPLRADRRWQA